MTVLKIQGEGSTHMVKLDKGFKPSFGICIVRGEVKDAPSSKMTGIFIKDIVPQSPAALCGKLKIGDRILSLNDNDVRNATEQNVIDLIRAAGQCINLQIQTFDISDQKGQSGQSGQYGQSGQSGQTSQNFQSDMKSQNQTNNNSSSNKNVVENGFMSNGAQNQETNKNQVNYSGSPEGSDDEDDTRDMTGRMYTEAGYEIDRASAGNVKRSKNEIAADTEQEDEYGYTQKKIKKRYGKLGNVHKTEVTRPANADLGLALAGHRDRQKMACMVAGVDPAGIAASGDLKAGDEILEVNGYVLVDRCHLNASVIFKNLWGEKIVFVVLRRTKGFEMAVKPVQRFPPQVDETEYLFTAYKNVRKVQIQKAGCSLGIMIIEGKHVEVGAGIFISDLQEDSNAMKAGLQVGEMILAINKDVIVDTNYDTAADILKRSQGLVTLVVANLKSEEQIAAEAKKAEEAAKKAEEKKNAPPPEPEKPQDPATAEIKTNQKTLIEIKLEKKPLGVVVSGGKNSAVTTGVLICHIFENGKIFEDKRLQVFDQIIELNGKPLNAAEMSVLKIRQPFYLEYDKVTMMVWRNDPAEVETVKVDINRKSGKDLGLSMAANPKGACVTNIVWDKLQKQIGVLTLIVSNLQTEGKVKTGDNENALPPEPEKPEEPATAEVQPNKRTLIEVKIDKRPLGCVVVGGRDSYVTTGVIITHIYEKGAIALDNRLQMFDQIIEFNGIPLNAADMSTLKVYQHFNLAYDTVSMIVWRNDPPEWETIQLNVSRKTGKDLGLAMVPNPKGIVVVKIASASCADIDGRLQIGDVINKLNGDCLEDMTFAESCALLKAATGKINFEIIRPKPTARR